MNTANQKKSIKLCILVLRSLSLASTLEIYSKEEFFAVRLDIDIPPEEKEFLKKRKVVVGQAFQKLFGLNTQLCPEKV